jgi:hypothetical protein
MFLVKRTTVSVSIAFAVHLSTVLQPVAAEPLGQGGDMALSADGHSGSVSALPGTPSAEALNTSLRFEPLTMVSDLYRDDIVFLMRHGPTDWSQIDRRGVDPKDCEHQRLMTDEGKEAMRQLGMHLIVSEIIPAQIRVSQWCRNAETLEALTEGMLAIDPSVAGNLVAVEDPGLNLLLSLGGAATVTPIKQMIADWMERGSEGPLLLITHYTNIEELTEFRVYEGEILVLDPTLDNRVLGYLRLDTASPDTIHFGQNDSN